MKAQDILLLATIVFTFNMATTTFKVEAYDPNVEIWESYEERLVQFFVANDVREDSKNVAILLSSVGPKGYGLLKNLVTLSKPSSMNLADNCKHLKEYYNPKPPVLLERFRFYNQRQGTSEGISEFLAELKRLSSSCNFGSFLNDALRDRFVCGVFDTNIQKRLLSEDDSLTLEKAVKVALSMESAAKKKKKKKNSYYKGEFSVTVYSQHVVEGHKQESPVFLLRKTRSCKKQLSYEGL
ncbi:hypothetical protein HOLleu_29642 [Holothuria leucospilota]|uniref:Uncharacterized protein n=1 Tax=Holothuria leucospilota TaxID=206669 RepID=A0A9Q1BP37_HOLLE|nr:hypothetical protein HOLleu_29642 [Holothuria leucospilota]